MNKFVEQSYEILSPGYGEEWADQKILIESAGRTCYQSQYHKQADGSTKMQCINDATAGRFIEKLYKNGHHAMLEFLHVTVRFVCDRGLTHELVRHRLMSFAQESTIYCNYKDVMTFVYPSTFETWTNDAQNVWKDSMDAAADAYRKLLSEGLNPKHARAVLPTSLKTEIVCSGNLREWMHVFDMRCKPQDHPDICSLMSKLREEFLIYVPEVFEDLGGIDERLGNDK